MVTPSVLVIARSALAAIVSLSVAELLPGVGSVTPAGAATVAVLLSVPLADSEQAHGVLTLARDPARGYFSLADVGLVEEIAEQLALAMSL